MEVEGAMRRDTNYLIVMKHVCKFCHKRFPCGRSLGGHMRSHLITNPSDHETTCKEKVNTSMEKKKEKKNQLIPPPTTNAGEFSGEANLKKKLSDQDPNQINCCKECGKAFHSSKALSGHMKSHAVEREKEKERQRQREKENSLLSDQIEKTPKQQVMDRESDNEAAEAAPKSNRRPRRTIRRQRYMGATSATTTTTTTTTNSSHNKNNGGSSSVSEIDQQEQENVAMCLIMLSRDVGPWGGVNGELSDNNSVFLEPKNRTGVAEEAGENRGLKQFKWVGESSTCKDFKGEGFVADDFLSSGYQKFLEKIKTSEGSGAELGVNLSSKSVLIQSESPNPAMSDVGSSKRKAKAEALESEKRSKFECTTCNKTFHSYQALGGHRASHKKAKGCSPSKAEGAHMGDVSVPLHKNQAKDTSEGGVKKGVHMTHKHACPICFKEFPSGQALGGHKRSHLMATATLAPLEAKFVSVEKSNATTVTTTTTTTTTTGSHEVRDFLDLNLPAPVEEEASNGHHQQQQLDLVGFKPWWVESTHKHEQLVSLISN